MTTDAPKRILIAPLDWGLGHAARCIPIVRALRVRGHEVIIGGQGTHVRLLLEEFPDLTAVSLVNYSMTYASTALGLMLQFPAMVARVLRCARVEHRELDALVDTHHIDAVISDQRFGCYSRKARSIYISHQLCVKMPWAFAPAEAMVARMLRYAAERFDGLWIPDYPGSDGLTGDLTHKYPLPRNHRFVGPLSRFANADGVIAGTTPCDLLVMLSGPEPQRTLFEQAVLQQLCAFDGSAVVLLGTPGREAPASPRPNVRVCSHLATGETAALLRGAGAVVCRGGYTTIMELISLGKKAVLVPTPGQTEQEYLCRTLAAQGRCVMQEQSRLDIRSGIAALRGLSAVVATPADQSYVLLGQAVDGLWSR